MPEHRAIASDALSQRPAEVRFGQASTERNLAAMKLIESICEPFRFLCGRVVVGG